MFRCQPFYPVCGGRICKLFKGVNTPNSAELDTSKRQELFKKLQGYVGDKLNDNCSFNAELLGLALAKMDKGKAAGFDLLTVEHLTNCHPVIFSILATLFNGMLKSSYVPTAFGKGIAIPIPKGETNQGVHSIDSFRSITLSPIVSKLFEHCLLLKFSDYFKTAMNQFGFKAKIGCPHAVYTVGKVTEFFVNHSIKSFIQCCY